MQAVLPQIVVSGRAGLILAVEVKNLPTWTLADAEQYVTDVFADEPPLGTRFLMLLSQETAFVWRVQRDGPRPFVFATQASVAPIFDGYRQRAGITRRLRGPNLRLLAADWLSRITDGTAAGEELPPALSAIGLVEALRGATVTESGEAE